MDGLVALTVEEFAVNELREPFHHWVRTHRFGVKSGDLVGPLPYRFPGDAVGGSTPNSESAVHRARDIWSEVDTDIRAFVKKEAQSLTKNLEAALLESGAAALKEERERFSHRLKEVQRAMAENSIAKLEKERSELQAEMRQRSFLADREREQEARLANVNEELQLRTHRFQELLEILRLEQTRVLEEVVPRRHRLRGQAQVFPVAVELRLPEEPS
jgi:exonuclease VII large subunit